MWGAGNAVCLDLGDGRPRAHIYKNAPSYTLKIRVIYYMRVVLQFYKIKTLLFFFNYRCTHEKTMVQEGNWSRVLRSGLESSKECAVPSSWHGRSSLAFSATFGWKQSYPGTGIRKTCVLKATSLPLPSPPPPAPDTAPHSFHCVALVQWCLRALSCFCVGLMAMQALPGEKDRALGKVWAQSQERCRL